MGVVKMVKNKKPNIIFILIDDMGWLADMNRPSKEHSSVNDDIKITEALKRINDIMKKII